MKERGKGAAVVLDKVRFAHGEVPFDFDLSIAAGERVAIMGPSGSGKSTLLNLIAGFETPDQGRILIAGEDVTYAPPAARPVSMIFQENNLFSHLAVAANVGLGRSPRLKLTQEDRDAVALAIERVGLTGKEHRRPAELSGGERQRVALARILVLRRPVLLLDEALASLDDDLKGEMRSLLSGLLDEQEMTLIMVTHDRDDADVLAERVVRIQGGRVAAT
ncbi:MAG: thiamine ABC transporter ATP-binding protein [Rhizobiaceae bacterium]|nr:thiamine ABC transporter ATP-binding protein [Rhizobiaceae bacterium]MCV0404605.1 thiamine ABC transporter ATP-binding protein [Rhizobiaceae bacterium]